MKLTKDLSYLIGRFISVIFRPILLYFYINFANADLTNKISLIYIISMISVAFSSFATHRNFFKYSKFDNLKLKKDKNFYKYYCSVIWIILFGIFINILIGIFYLNNFYLVAACVFIFIVDKIYDEIQRFLIFTKQFTKWGIFSSYRAVAFIFSFTFSIYFFESYFHILFASIFYLILFIIININIFSIKLNKLRIMNISSFQFISQHVKFLIISVLSSSICYSDRVVLMIAETNKIGLLTYFSSIFAIVPASINFFYLSSNLAEFAKNKINFKNIISDKKFWKIIIFSSFLSWLVIFLSFLVSMYLKSGNILYSNYYMLLLIYCISIMTALGSLLITKIYWTSNYIFLIYLDTAFWFLVGLLLFYFQNKYIAIEFSILFIFILYLLRNLFLIHISK
jgi:hypothetical protein